MLHDRGVGSSKILGKGSGLPDPFHVCGTAVCGELWLYDGCERALSILRLWRCHADRSVPNSISLQDGETDRIQINTRKGIKLSNIYILHPKGYKE